MPQPPYPPFDPPPDDARSDANTLRIENEALRRGFTLIPNYILRARGISRDAKMLYSILLSYAWQTDSCFPGYDRLMEDMQCGRPQVAKYIKELKDVGLIEVRRRGQGMTSIYTLKDIRGEEIQKFQNETSRSFDSEPQGVSERNSKKYSVEENPDEENSKSRKGTRQAKTTGSQANTATRHTPLSRIRQASISNLQEDEDDVSQEMTSRVQGDPGVRISKDMSPGQPSRRAGIEAIGATLLRRRPGRPSADQAEARRAVRRYIEDYGRQLGDQAPKSSVTRALNLMEEAGVALGLFIGALQDTYKKTQQKSANIQKLAENGRTPYPQKNKMPYFFSLLEEELGLRTSTPAEAGAGGRQSERPPDER